MSKEKSGLYTRRKSWHTKGKHILLLFNVIKLFLWVYLEAVHMKTENIEINSNKKDSLWLFSVYFLVSAHTKQTRNHTKLCFLLMLYCWIYYFEYAVSSGSWRLEEGRKKAFFAQEAVCDKTAIAQYSNLLLSLGIHCDLHEKDKTRMYLNARNPNLWKIFLQNT